MSTPPPAGSRGPGARAPGLDAGQILDGLARAVGQACAGQARLADRYSALVGARAAQADYLGAAEYRGAARAHEDAAAELAAVLAGFGLQPPGRPHGAPGPAPLAAARPGLAAGAGLGGTGRLADELYLAAHDDVTGKPRLHPRAVALGIAAALLAELMLGGQLTPAPDGTLAAAPDVPAPADALAGQVLAQVAAEQEPLGTRDWLAFLSQTAAADVAGRLAQAGYLEPVPGRWPRSRDRWVPADQSKAFAAVVRARSALDPARPLTVPAAALAALADAAGLRPLLLQYAPAAARQPGELTAVLPLGMRDLIAHARAAADSALLAGRT
ncbi:MAG TPA: GPP34 family phosphoprotein [Streptosporangiaceae bacterium]|nr:GPP34 family phosphoprotein [Streptosporangiaceae bacterium]